MLCSHKDKIHAPGRQVAHQPGLDILISVLIDNWGPPSQQCCTAQYEAMLPKPSDAAALLKCRQCLTCVLTELLSCPSPDQQQSDFDVTCTKLQKPTAWGTPAGSTFDNNKGCMLELACSSLLHALTDAQILRLASMYLLHC